MYLNPQYSNLHVLLSSHAWNLLITTNKKAITDWHPLPFQDQVNFSLRMMWPNQAPPIGDLISLPIGRIIGLGWCVFASSPAVWWPIAVIVHGKPSPMESSTGRCARLGKLLTSVATLFRRHHRRGLGVNGVGRRWRDPFQDLAVLKVHRNDTRQMCMCVCSCATTKINKKWLQLHTHATWRQNMT